MSKLSHLDAKGRAAMVDVSAKKETARTAEAEAVIVLSRDAYDLALSADAPKGDVLAAARLAGIMAAKKTSELIPLCHPLSLSHAGVALTPLPARHALRIVATVKTTGQTGVEMEALTAASVAALTVYDMIKAVDRGAVIETVRLLEKSGGKSGTYKAPATPAKDEPAAPKRVRAMPEVLSDAEPAPRRAQKNPHGERDALRAFMTARHLRASEWARSAQVPVNVLYGFLSGRARHLDPAAAERLARAARTSVDAMLGRAAR